MHTHPISFVIPTYRLRDVGATVRDYDDNFRRNGHNVPIVVFDDSSTATQAKYFADLEAVKTHNELSYVGPREKEEFLAGLLERLRDRKLVSVVRNLFRPSYGGNRNFTLMYTLGGQMISADDDMRPHALIENNPESLAEGEVCRGKLVKANSPEFSQRSFDILTSFSYVLGRTVAELPSNYERGEMLTDTAMDLETNTTNKGLARENSLLLQPGRVPKTAVVKMAQTYRSGTNDIDAVDYVDMFLDDAGQTRMEDLNDLYVIVNFRPAVTNKNWRMDCGVAGYDNRFGLPPFFPTRLRFEDYVYRLWIRQKGLASVHVDSVQTHTKSNYMRNPPAAEVFNEEICTLLKRKIFGTVSKMDELTIAFDYDGEVTAEDAEAILSKVTDLHSRALAVAGVARSPERREELRAFALNLQRTFYGFEPDFFQQNVSRMVDDVVSLIKASLDLWPTLVEICFFAKHRRELPKVRVNNIRKVRVS